MSATAPATLAGRPCAVCATPVRRVIAEWTARCPRCGAWISNLEPRGAEINTQTRVTGLVELRRRNFREILGRLDAIKPMRGAAILDVGSAYGWFLEEAAARGARATGVEPDAGVAATASARGLDVRVDFFPAAVAGESGAYDVVTFNDVLEHLDDLPGVLRACHEVLRPDGILAVNIPTSDGLAFRIASALARIGIHGPYQRLWQHGFPSPHRHYLPKAALRDLLERHGFAVESIRPLSAISRDGLWERLHTSRRPSPVSVVTFAGLYALAPVFNSPRVSDVVLAVARPRSSGRL